MNFNEALDRIPPPGEGKGCHPYLLACANLGIREGLTEEAVTRAILAAIPAGTRTISEREVRDTVLKAHRDRLGGKGMAKPNPHGVSLSSYRVADASMLNRMMHPEDVRAEDFVSRSPVPFDPDDGVMQAKETLRNLFGRDECVFIGEAMSNGTNRIGTVDQWCALLDDPKSSGKMHEHVIWNPLFGYPVKSGAGKMSLRCDAAVSAYRYCVAEFDDLPMEAQLRFWAGCRLPLAALVYSGGKSLHGVLKLEGIRSSLDWDAQVKTVLYKRWLVPLGVDPACSNPSRLSRMPGSLRSDNGRMQKLLYLNPAATPIKLEL